MSELEALEDGVEEAIAFGKEYKKILDNVYPREVFSKAVPRKEQLSQYMSIRDTTPQSVQMWGQLIQQKGLGDIIAWAEEMEKELSG